ncbi:MAG: hypothetical protein ACE5KH_00415 [Candidatus Geothermarchaeales archaeon]
MTGLWTKVAVAFLALVAISNFVFVFTQGVNPLLSLIGVLFLVLAGLAWRETEWGSLLVMVAGVVMATGEFAGGVLYYFPEFEPEPDLVYAAIPFLLVAVVGYMSYREVRRRAQTH